jgi:hypothetical protein
MERLNQPDRQMAMSMTAAVAAGAITDHNGGGSNANTASQTQRSTRSRPRSALQPAQPEGHWRREGARGYTIPAANKFASDGDPKTLGEPPYGFRNAHRLSWDVDGSMFASDIGMNHIRDQHRPQWGTTAGCGARLLELAGARRLARRTVPAARECVEWEGKTA